MARLVAITEVKNVPPDVRPFVEFKAAVEDRKLDQDELVALLNIDTSACYVPVFLKDPVSLAQLEKDLSSQDAKLAPDSKEVLSQRLKK